MRNLLIRYRLWKLSREVDRLYLANVRKLHATSL